MVSVLNVNGDVMVAGKIKHYKDISSWPAPTLKGTTPDAPSCYIKAGKRKFYCTIYERPAPGVLVASFSAKKKILIGWVKYRADYSYYFTKGRSQDSGDIPLSQHGVVRTIKNLAPDSEIPIVHGAIPGDYEMVTWNSGVGTDNKQTIIWTYSN